MQQLLRIGLPAQADAPVRPTILMHPGYLVAMIIPICQNLASGAERLACEWWTRMTFFLKGLVQIAVKSAVPVAAVVEELTKMPYGYLSDADRVGGHELA